jgi:two-component system sensor histidine kinase/response regulator
LFEICFVFLVVLTDCACLAKQNNNRMEKSKKRILVVDDVPELRSVTVNVLSNAGYEVFEVKTGKEALCQVPLLLPDIILLDIVLPDLNGVEVCRQIKTMKFECPPYVVLFSAERITSDDQAIGLEGGADGYMSRPITNRELLARIESFYRFRDTEEALRESEKKLIDLNEQKTKIFSIIAHDLKAPFNSILGFADIMNNNLDSLDEEELEMSAFNIYSSALEANNLLSNLLEWSKLNWRAAKFHPQVFNLFELMEDVEITYQSIIDSKEIDLELDVDEDLDVHADREMVHTIIRNLLTNAIKFSHVEGEIVLSAEEHDNFVHIEVKDNGVGIKEEDKVKILENDGFFSTIGTHDEKGSGLGLHICKDLIAKNKGKIWFESKENEGTRFYISLPLAEKQKQKEEKKRDPKPENIFSDINVLVAEDIDHVYRFIEFALKKTNAHLHWVKNGKEAVEYLKTHFPDIVLMDISMPEMDGIAAIREIRKFNVDIPIIAQSAYNLNGELEQSLKAGGSDYIQKPIIADELIRKMKKILHK